MLSVDVVSDFACPWCFIGSRRLAAVLGARAESGGDAQVRYHPFQLNADTPAAGADLRDYLRERYGAEPEEMFGRVEAAARDAGIALDFAKVRTMPNTLSAHILVAAIQDSAAQRALADAIFSAYFLEGRDIGDAAVLAELAAPHGLRAEQVAALLANDGLRQRVRGLAESMTSQGITGVPFFIFNQKLALSGAQPPEVFQRALAEAEKSAE
ncbi:MAG: DsbA family oxidoreductase [Candidatus Didemnitutus sp.]|nr:DsbA family oxidoreductase [Candidatus Didemnitutus sp.]